MHPDDSVIERFLSFKPWQYRYIERLELYTGFEDDSELSLNSLVVKLELLSNLYESNLCIAFQGVKSLQLNIEGDNPQLMGGLMISSVREQQWERVTYQVSEREGNHVSFLCRDFHVWLAEEDRLREEA